MDLQPVKVLLLQTSEKTGKILQRNIVMSNNPATVHAEAMSTFDCRRLKQDPSDIILLDFSGLAFPEAVCYYQKICTCHKPVLSLIPNNFFDRSRDFILPGQSDYLVLSPESVKDIMHRIRYLLFVNKLYIERENARAMDDKIERLVKEKQFLLKEVYHRVGNMLQIVCSLLDLDCVDRAEENYEKHDSGSGRVRSLRRIYSIYMGAENRGNIDMKKYINWLCDSKLKMLGPGIGSIRFDVDAAPVDISQEKVFGFGVMLDELLNVLLVSVKKCPPEYKKVYVSIAQKDGIVHVTMEGPGENMLSPDSQQVERSLGWKLVRNIVEYQLDGTLSFSCGESNRVEIHFPGTNI